jgi:hypothetical protein
VRLASRSAAGRRDGSASCRRSAIDPIALEPADEIVITTLVDNA